MVGVKATLEADQVAQRDPGRGGMASLLRSGQPGQQRGHRRPLVGDDPHITLGAGEREHPGQGIYRGGVITAGRPRQRPQRPGFDYAADAVLADRRRVQPVHQREGPVGPALGEQHPGQQQIARLVRVVRLVVRAEAAFLRPVGGGSQVTLTQQ